jgi:hypothetical protein
MYMQKAKTLRTQEANTMTRAERNEFTYLWKNLKRGFYGNTAILTIPVDASREYKQSADDLFQQNGFYPCAIKTDPKRFDDRKRILYMKEPEDAEWTELYTKEELDAFDQAIEA